MIRLTWTDFDHAVEQIAAAWSAADLCAVHGIARGGLPLAVAVSHRLGVPLVDAPAPDVLTLDDIHDTGQTLRRLRAECPDLGPVHVWVTRQTDPADYGYDAVLTDVGPAWIVFPWEDPVRAEADRLAYLEGLR
ncbi:MAG: phosphoribosyltransferase [Gammaproteobacteria bacterium]|nr:phosphoribosyltransferase [Gammaproteobacteria bacterium]